MKLNELFEPRKQTVGIIFGRFNPPHKGHKAAWEVASKADHWFVGTNENTQGPKDPLPFNVKVEAMKTVWPIVESHIVSTNTWLTMASDIYNQYGDVNLLVCTEESWVTEALKQYNGKDLQHGYYNFSRITQQPTPRLSSATALRDAVVSGSREAFSEAAGVDADTMIAGESYFDIVANHLNTKLDSKKPTQGK